MAWQTKSGMPLKDSDGKVIVDSDCCCGGCCDNLPSTLTATATMVNGVDLPHCAQKSITFTKVGPFLWRASVTSWCTDPATFDLEFTCSADPDDPEGGVECITDFYLRAVISGTPESWESPSQCNCDPDDYCGLWESVEGINDSTCCTSTPGSLTVEIGTCPAAGSSNSQQRESMIDPEFLDDPILQEWRRQLAESNNG